MQVYFSEPQFLIDNTGVTNQRTFVLLVVTPVFVAKRLHSTAKVLITKNHSSEEVSVQTSLTISQQPLSSLCLVSQASLCLPHRVQHLIVQCEPFAKLKGRVAIDSGFHKVDGYEDGELC